MKIMTEFSLSDNRILDILESFRFANEGTLESFVGETNLLNNYCFISLSLSRAAQKVVRDHEISL